MVANRSRYEVTEDWSASWIWCEGESHPRNFHIYARKAFKLASKPVSARIRITADSRYRLYVNGNYVGWGAANSITRRLTYDTYDITPFLNRGNNAIAVIAYHLGHPASNYIPRRAALICEADIELKSGAEKIVTDESWRVIPAAAWTDHGSRVARNLGYQQVYDAALDADGWNEAKFNDSKWLAPHVLGQPPMSPFGRLMPRDIPRVVEQNILPVEIVGMYDAPPMPAELLPPDVPRFISQSELKPIEAGRVDKSERILAEGDDATMVRVPTEGGVSIILDFGRQVYGSLEIALSKCTSGILDIAYDETIDPKNGIRPDRGGIRYTDRIIIKKGKQVWSSFEPRAFRYVQLDFRECAKPFALNHVFVRDSAFPIALIGAFESSDQTLNYVWQNGVDSVRRVLMESYLDSPWRDRTPSFADAVAAIRPAYSAFGEAPLVEERLRHIAASQRRDGALLALHPSAENRVFVDLAMLFVIAVWDNYVCGGDKELLADLYPTIDRWHGWISRFVDDDGLLFDVRADLLLDWGGVNRHAEMAGLSCMYLGALVAMKQMAEVLRRDADAVEYDRIAVSLRAAIDKNFWSEKRGLYSDTRMYGKLDEHFSRQTNILAARFDVPNHYQKSSILRQVLDERGLPQVNSPIFTAMLVETMCRAGYVEEVLGFIRQTWGRNAGVSSSILPPVHQLQAYLLGAVPTGNPARLRFEPHIADLRWAEGVIPTPSGPVRVRWKAGIRGFAMDVELPNGVTAEIVPPRHELGSRITVDGAQTGGSVIELGPGFHSVLISRSRTPGRIPQVPIEVEIVELVETIHIPPNRGDIETVEQMIQILTQMEKEHVYVIPSDDEDEGVIIPEARLDEPERKSRRRGRRGRDRREEPVRETETAEVAPAIETEFTEEIEPSLETATTSEEQGRENRPRRRRRRGRGRSGSQPFDGSQDGEVTESTETTEAVEPVEQAAEATQETSEPVEESSDERSDSRRPRRRRRRSRSGQDQPVSESPTDETVVEEPVEAERVASEEPEASSDQPSRRPRRRRRRSGRGGQNSQTAETVQAEAAPEPVEVAPAPEPEQTEQSEHRSRSRSRSRRRRSPRPVEEQPEAVAPVVEPAPSEAPARPARQRTRRAPKPAEATEQPAAEPVASQPSESDKAPRRRTRRTAKPAEPVVEPSSEPAASESAPKPRRRRPARKPATSEETPSEG